MPRRLNMVRDPVVNRLVIVLAILDILMHLRRIVRVAGLVPGAHVDADGEAVREQLLRRLDVDVASIRRRVGVEARVVRGELATEG